jgi:hypothetical protein
MLIASRCSITQRFDYTTRMLTDFYRSVVTFYFVVYDIVQSFHQFFITYKRTLVYLLFFFNLFFMFTIIKTLNNYLILTNTIQTEETKYATLQEQIAYTQKFLEPYLLSDFSPYFLGHENGRYLP